MTLQTKDTYLPIVFHDTFWHLKETYLAINETTKVMPLHFIFDDISMFKCQLLSKLDASFTTQRAWGQTESDIDEFKRMFLDNSWWLLSITFIVSLLHGVFDMLAFKNGFFSLLVLPLVAGKLKSQHRCAALEQEERSRGDVGQNNFRQHDFPIGHHALSLPQ